MNKRRAVNPVIIEIIIVVLFFALAAAASMRLFTAIALINARNDMSVNAAADCASAVDEVKANPGALKFQGGICEYQADCDGAGYTVTVNVRADGQTQNGTLYSITATAETDSEEIFVLETAFFDYKGVGSLE